MTNGKQIIIRCIAILMLCGIVFLGGYGLYRFFRDIDKPVPIITKIDSLGRPFEINGYKFYLRDAALYDEKGNMIADLSIDNESASKNAQYSPSMKDELKEGWGGTKKNFEDYSIFGCSKEDAQRLYIQSVINSMASGKTIEVSRWVTSGDWSHDDDEMTITITIP